MQYTITIKSIDKQLSQVDNQQILDVTVGVNLVEEKKPPLEVFERRLTFPLATTQEQLQAELGRYLEAIVSEQMQAQAQAQADQAQAKADELIKNNTGQTLTLNLQEKVGVADQPTN